VKGKGKEGSLGIAVIKPHLGVSSEQAIALQIEKNALIEMLNIENAITAALEDFDFVIEAFHKSTRLSLYCVLMTKNLPL
jgi:hypothetical protein